MGSVFCTPKHKRCSLGCCLPRGCTKPMNPHQGVQQLQKRLFEDKLYATNICYWQAWYSTYFSLFSDLFSPQIKKNKLLSIKPEKSIRAYTLCTWGQSLFFYCFFPRTKYHACIDLSEGVVGSCKILCKVLMATDYEEKLEEQKLRPNSDSSTKTIGLHCIACSTWPFP